jgi:hypothetical protein
MGKKPQRQLPLLANCWSFRSHPDHMGAAFVIYEGKYQLD